MAEVIEYYKEYLELKLHFNSENFIYDKDHASLYKKWNHEPEARKEWWRKIRLEMTVPEFRRIVIANLLENSEIYFLKLKKNAAFIRDFNTYWSNPAYYFQKDLEKIKGKYEDVWKLQQDGEIRIETIMFLEKLDVLDAHSLQIKKYMILMEDKIDWSSIKQVFKNFKEE